METIHQGRIYILAVIIIEYIIKPTSQTTKQMI